MFHLKTFSLSFLERLVICHLKHDVRYVLPKKAHQFLLGGCGIVDGVMQDGRKQHPLIINAGFVGQYIY